MGKSKAQLLQRQGADSWGSSLDRLSVPGSVVHLKTCCPPVGLEAALANRGLWGACTKPLPGLASYMLLLPSLCWHVCPLGELVRSWDGLAPSQDVEGSSAEVLPGSYESQSSKAIVLWSSNCASVFQQKWWAVLVGISKYVVLARGMVGFPR